MLKGARENWGATVVGTAQTHTQLLPTHVFIYNCRGYRHSTYMCTLWSSCLLLLELSSFICTRFNCSQPLMTNTQNPCLTRLGETRTSVNVLISKLHSTMVLLASQCCFLLVSAMQHLAFQTYPLAWASRLTLFHKCSQFIIKEWGTEKRRCWSWLAQAPCAPLKETAGMVCLVVQLLSAACASSLSALQFHSSELWWF